jgi:membrane protein YqaA with SNARE-associated domain
LRQYQRLRRRLDCNQPDPLKPSLFAHLAELPGPAAQAAAFLFLIRTRIEPPWLAFYPLRGFPERQPLPYNGSLPVHKILLKISAWIAALKALGGWGLLLLAVIDSIAIPIPLDALVASYVYSLPHKAWLYCIAAAVGSAVGSLVPYALGRAGGELFLLKRIDESRLQRIRDRFEKQEFLALMVPAILPPPTPFKLFVFSAGVFEMKVLDFLLAITSGRLIRFAAVSVLTIIFGPQIVT